MTTTGDYVAVLLPRQDSKEVAMHVRRIGALMGSVVAVVAGSLSFGTRADALTYDGSSTTFCTGSSPRGQTAVNVLGSVWGYVELLFNSGCHVAWSRTCPATSSYAVLGNEIDRIAPSSQAASNGGNNGSDNGTCSGLGGGFAFGRQWSYGLNYDCAALGYGYSCVARAYGNVKYKPSGTPSGWYSNGDY